MAWWKLFEIVAVEDWEAAELGRGVVEKKKEQKPQSTTNNKKMTTPFSQFIPQECRAVRVVAYCCHS